MTKSTEITSEDFFKQGHVWVAPVWSIMDQANKPRPVVIVGNDKANDQLDIVINFVTKTAGRGDYDVKLEHWKAAGLKVESWVRTSKPLTIQKSQLRTEMITRNGVKQPKGYIGKLNDTDLANIIEKCKSIF